MAEHVAELGRQARDFGLGEYPRDALIFSDDSKGARPYNRDSINARFRLVSEKYGVPVVSAHELRHYAATLLAPHMTSTELVGASARTPAMVHRCADYKRTVDGEAARLMGEAPALADVVAMPVKRASA